MEIGPKQQTPVKPIFCLGGGGGGKIGPQPLMTGPPPNIPFSTHPPNHPESENISAGDVLKMKPHSPPNQTPCTPSHRPCQCLPTIFGGFPFGNFDFCKAENGAPVQSRWKMAFSVFFQLLWGGHDKKGIFQKLRFFNPLGRRTEVPGSKLTPPPPALKSRKRGEIKSRCAQACALCHCYLSYVCKT